MVKVFVSYREPNYNEPWQAASINSRTGSGCAIAGRRILTAAHVVEGQTFVEVRRNSRPEKHQARLLYVSHATDLALLGVDDSEFWEGIEPLALGPLPKVGTEVAVFGFSQGGDTLSTTLGVVSRVEHQSYVHSNRSLLAIQVDAAINPGNSGGPAIVERKIVGIAMQKVTNAENTGYLVPAPLIEHFLRDVEDGKVDGIPLLGVSFEVMESAYLKARHQMPRAQTGVLVTTVTPGSPADGSLKPGDVILSAGDKPVGDDGTVEFRPEERTRFGIVVERFQIGESVHVEALRDGAVVRLDVKLKPWRGRIHGVGPREFDATPRYLLYGGLAFTPLTLNLLEVWGDDWYKDAPRSLVRPIDDIPEAQDEEGVVLLRVFPTEGNEGYHRLGKELVGSLNGTTPRNLQHLAELLEVAQGRFVTFMLKDGKKEVVLDREKAAADTPTILKRYGLTANRSANLRWEQ
jgi:S1-C subfamily serine protease